MVDRVAGDAEDEVEALTLRERGLDAAGLDVREVLEGEQRALAALLADIRSGRAKSPLAEGERFDLVLGVTCHAVYHAGQVQLIKRLKGD